MILRMPINQASHLVIKKLITEEKTKFLHQLKFIIHQEEDPIFNSVESIKSIYVEMIFQS